jgi:MscS family membrane protein
MRQLVAGPAALGRTQPKIWPDAVVVRFGKLAPCSLDVEVLAWFLTTSIGEFQAIRREILLGFMDVVERSGTGFAFPIRTVYLAQENTQAPWGHSGCS